MHGLVLLDAADTVLRPAILWNDQRTARACDEIREAVGRERLIAITGNDALTGFTAPKLVWVRDQEPDIWSRVAHVLLPKDYVRLRLTGDHAMDKADGAGTILFDLAARDWSPEVVAALRIDPAWLPPTFEGPVVTGTVGATAAAATGLRAGTPVVAGGGDQAANAVGRRRGRRRHRGPVARHVRASSFAATDEPLIEPHGRVHAFCHAVPDRWHMMSVMLSAAGSLRWFRDALAPGRRVRRPRRRGGRGRRRAATGCCSSPTSPASAAPTPTRSPAARSSGLTVGHDRRHLTRAVLEGVAFGLRDGLDLMVDAGMPAPAQIRASGGGTASPLWRQILADVLGAEIATVGRPRAPRTAPALLAAVGAGWFATVDAARGARRDDAGRVTGPGRAAVRASCTRSTASSTRRSRRRSPP